MMMRAGNVVDLGFKILSMERSKLLIIRELNSNKIESV